PKHSQDSAGHDAEYAKVHHGFDQMRPKISGNKIHFSLLNRWSFYTTLRDSDFEMKAFTPSTSTFCSDLPEKTATFYGREQERQRLRQGLDPSQPGGKSVLFSGTGGTGKTQLALQQRKKRSFAPLYRRWLPVMDSADGPIGFSPR